MRARTTQLEADMKVSRQGQALAWPVATAVLPRWDRATYRGARKVPCAPPSANRLPPLALVFLLALY